MANNTRKITVTFFLALTGFSILVIPGCQYLIDEPAESQSPPIADTAESPTVISAALDEKTTPPF